MAKKTYPIASTCFARIEYDDETQELWMTFQKGGTYKIPKIEEIEVERWVEAQSVGGYFNDFVRGNY